MANDVSGADRGPSTVTEALAALQADGYTTDFSVADGGMLRCGRCGTLHDPADATVERTVRFEGDTDPGDEAIVFGLRCSGCGSRGTLVSAYGPSAGPDEARVIIALSTAR